MLKKITSAFALLLLGYTAFAQPGEEKLVPLWGNPVLKQHLAQKHRPTTGIIRKSGIQDTLTLPFFDDFSKGEVFPDEKRWTDRLAYTNTDFAVKPPSVGVATLDALDSTGRPYFNIRAGQFGPCDTLTSQPIDISAYDSNNNIRISFYYQAQGFAFWPLKAKDSLVLQFKTGQGFWYTVWSTPGLPLADFKAAIVKIDSQKYFHTGFQFRFINYLNYEGGIGQWHIDYVFADLNRTAADTLFRDVALSAKPQSLLNDYEEMPYNQYRGFEAFEARTATEGALSNLDTTGRTVDIFNREAVDELGNSIYKAQLGGLVLNPLTTQTYPFLNPTVANSTQTADTCIYTVSEYLKITGANFKTENDSFARKLTFANYYAYDDGTAESGYSLARGAGKIAYRFRLNKPDTLRAISVYYFRAEDTVKRPFSISVWKTINPNAAGEQLIYSIPVTYPTYTDSINGYHTYVLDSAIAVSGEFYIGWTQSSIFNLHVGWDRNYTNGGQSIANPNLYFNSTGKWFQSFIPGTLMMRPHVGKSVKIDTTVLSTGPGLQRQANTLVVYPNPVSNTLTVQLPADGSNYTYTVSDIAGKTVLQGTLNSYEENTVDVAPLSNGLYFIILHHPTQGQYFTKFIKQ